MMNYILARLAEPSTWRGVILLVATALGTALTDQQVAQLTQVALGVVGLLGVFTPDNLGDSK